MAEEKPDLTVAGLAALTAEVISDEGAGSHTQRFNEAVVEAFRENQGTVPGELEDIPMLLLTMRGARTGAERTIPLGAWSGGGDRVIVCASMGGAHINPPWFHNVRANPDVTVEFRGERYPATAVIHTGEEREMLFAKIVEQMPVFGEYQARTSRLLPVVEFVRRDDPEASPST